MDQRRSFIGSGGTFTNLGRMAHRPARAAGAGDSIHGTSVTDRARWSSCSSGSAPAPPEQRRNVPGLNPERADIILAGLAVTAELLDLRPMRAASR